jgi:hypothetical protein
VEELVVLNKIISFINKYELEDNIIEYAGIFRYLGSFRNGFLIEDWLKLSTKKIDYDVAFAFLELLSNLELIRISDKRYFCLDDRKLQKTFELVADILSLYSDRLFKNYEHLLWTLPIGTVEIPHSISTNFLYLNSWINNTIQTTTNRLIFIAPYFSVSGIKNLVTSLNALLKKKQIIIDWIVCDINNKNNFEAFDFLRKTLDKEYLNNISFYSTNTRTHNPFVFHAKVLLSDEKKGYIGSANFSKNGLENMLELGIELNEEKSRSLTQLVDFLIEKKAFVKFFVSE